MAITLGKQNLDNRTHVIGNRREVICDGILDNSYPSGGYALTFATLGVDLVPDYVQVQPTTTGHTFPYDYANQKIRVFSGGTEVSATTDLHTVVVRIIASGKGNPTL